MKETEFEPLDSLKCPQEGGVCCARDQGTWSLALQTRGGFITSRCHQEPVLSGAVRVWGGTDHCVGQMFLGYKYVVTFLILFITSINLCLPTPFPGQQKSVLSS